MIMPAHGELPEAPLLWPANEIVSVRDSTLEVELKRDVGCHYVNGVLSLAQGSRATSISEAGLWRGSRPRIEENHRYHLRQIFVTHRHDPEFSEGPVPHARLDYVRSKLVLHGRIKFAVLGDSIAGGASAYGSNPVAPYLPSGPEAVTCRMEVAMA